MDLWISIKRNSRNRIPPYSNRKNAVSVEDFAHILQYPNVENASVFLANVCYRLCEEKGVTFDEFSSFFQFLNSVEVFAITYNTHNFASHTAGQKEHKYAVYLATGLQH